MRETKRDMAKGFSENKLPHLFTVADGEPFAIAGIWETWERGDPYGCLRPR